VGRDGCVAGASPLVGAFRKRLDDLPRGVSGQRSALGAAVVTHGDENLANAK